MPFSRLFIWVEGPDDERFLNSVFRQLLERRYDWVQIVSYSGMTKPKVAKWIESIRDIEAATYIFLADNDKSPCVLAKKEELVRKVKSLQASHIAIVVEEIESWYLAGLTAEGRHRLAIGDGEHTSAISKEEFDQLRHEDFESRVDWMIEMLRGYSLEHGVSRNPSLHYFVSKFLSNGTTHK